MGLTEWQSALCTAGLCPCVFAALCPRHRPALRSCRGALPSSHACCLPPCAKQDGLRYLAFLFRGSRSPFARSRGVGAVICLGGFISGLCVSLWRSRRVTGTRGRSYEEERGRRRGASESLRNRIGLAMLSAGSTLGLRAPDCAKESSTLWTLFTLRRGCVGAYTRRHPGTRKDPPESNLCSGGSGCIAMLPIRTNVQTRSAPKR